MPLVTISREDEVQRCPVEKNAPLVAHSTAFLRSASSRTTSGFLPPISSCTFFIGVAAVAAAATFRPVATEPVNDTAATPGCLSRASPISLPRPMTRLKTPGGSPDFEMIPARACAEPGTRSAGLNTTQLPYASAGAIFQAGIATGKFQGVIN